MMSEISVLLPDPLDPTSAVVVPAGAWNETSFSTGTPGVVLEVDVLEPHVAVQRRQRRARRVLLVLGGHAADLADAVEAGERLGDLRADRRDVHERRRRSCR